MKPVIMPKLDLVMEKGVVVEWLKAEGARVEKDETIVIIMSEKATLEVTAPTSGTLYRIVITQDKEAPVGAVLAFITEPGDDPSIINKTIHDVLKGEVRVTELGELRAAKEPPKPVVLKKTGVSRVQISPAARRLANEHGLDVTKLRGTGPEGRIVREDILKAIEKLRAEGIVAEPSVVSRVVLVKGLKKVVAERMAYSYQNAPHVTLTMNVDMTGVRKMRESLKGSQGESLPYNAFFVKAVAEALKKHPLLNSRFRENRIEMFADINVGVAVAAPQGLVVPVIRNADRKPLADVARSIDELVKVANEDKLSVGDLTGVTFTVTNLGMFGVEAFTPIIAPDQAAILGIGEITERPCVAAGQVVAKPLVTLCLSFDHRIVDGAPAGRFLQTVKQLLEKPDLVEI